MYNPIYNQLKLINGHNSRHADWPIQIGCSGSSSGKSRWDRGAPSSSSPPPKPMSDSARGWFGLTPAISIHHSYGHLLVITGYFYGIIHSINGVISTYNW